MATNLNDENSVVVRSGEALYFIYRGYPAGSDPAANKTYVREFDLRTRQFVAVSGSKTARDVFAGGSTSPTDYHAEPSLVRDGSGTLHPLGHCSPVTRCPPSGFPTSSELLPPRHRAIPDLASSEAAWSPIARLPVRATSLAYSPLLYDVMGVFDANTVTSHLVGEGLGQWAGVNGVGDPPNTSGLHRIYYRIGPLGNFMGPYLLVRGTIFLPAGYPAGGSVFNKGMLVLGKEPLGPRSLHLMWNTRHTFCRPDCWNANNVVTTNYDLYYARSVDGGETWTSLDGQRAVSLAATPAQSIAWNGGADQAHWRVYEGDVKQNTERAWDVDPSGRPVVAVIRWNPARSRPPTVVVNGRTHVNAGDTPGEDPWYDLVLRRFDGSRWLEYDIDSTQNFYFYRPKLRVDRKGGFWVFLGNRYKRSSDRGATWSPWAPLPNTNGMAQPGRLVSYADPIEPDFHVLVYKKQIPSYLAFTRMQLTPIERAIACVAVPPGGGTDEDSFLRRFGANTQWNPIVSRPAAIRIGDCDSVSEGCQYRSILSFDTKVIPANATLTSARLELKRAAVVNQNPFDDLGEPWVDLARGAFNESLTVEPEDFDAVATLARAGRLVDGTTTTSTLAVSALPQVNRAGGPNDGRTQLRIHFDIPSNRDGNSDQVGYYSCDNAAPADRPRLTVEYLLPAQ